MSKRLSYKIDSILGVDMTSNPANVAKNRATYMRNMINIGGINHKRKGMHQIYEYLDSKDTPLKINGIHPCTINGSEELLIHAGCDFYKENGERIQSLVDITDTKSQIFSLNNLVYIVGCGGLYQYDGETISDIKHYIPTTRRSFDFRYGESEAVESPNLLYRRQKELFCGKRYKDEVNTFLQLEKTVDFSEDVVVNVEISHLFNDLRLCKDTPNPDADKRLEYSPTLTFMLTSERAESGVSIECEPINGKRIYFIDEVTSSSAIQYPRLTFMGTTNRITFNFNTTPSADEDFNICVEYSSTEDKRSDVTGCVSGALIQDSRGNTRLALSANTLKSNILCYSDSFNSHGVAYFPESCAFNVGDGAPITALYNLSRTNLGVFKKNKFFRYTITHNPLARELSQKTYVTGHESQSGQGCISPYVCATVNGDHLVYDGDGVFGIEDALSSGEKSYLEKRSINIEKGLIKHSPEEISSAVACEHEGRYYLFLGDRVYIADTRYRFNDTSSHSQYEWWTWDGIKARSVCEYKGKLLIGTDDGRIYEEGEDYRDIHITKIGKSGDFVYQDGILYLSSALSVNEKTFLKLKGAALLCKEGDFDYRWEGKHLIIECESPYSHLEIGDTVSVILHSGAHFDAQCIGNDENEAMGLITLKPLSDTNETLQENIKELYLYENGKKEYSLIKDGDNYRILYKGTPIEWQELTALTLCEGNSVMCVLYTSMLNFDEPLRTKTLLRIGVSVANENAGSVNFGWETRKSTLSRLDGFEALDFASFDFDKLSFEFPFAKTYERRVLERNFNHIMFKLSSGENADCAINEINAVYIVTGYIKGVR